MHPHTTRFQTQRAEATTKEQVVCQRYSRGGLRGEGTLCPLTYTQNLPIQTPFRRSGSRWSVTRWTQRSSTRMLREYYQREMRRRRTVSMAARNVAIISDNMDSQNAADFGSGFCVGPSCGGRGVDISYALVCVGSSGLSDMIIRLGVFNDGGTVNL